jgi:DNA-binding beta-propeller fold protein YncE
MSKVTRHLLAFSLAALVLNAQGVRVLQTNSAGDNVTVIDPVTNQVVGAIEDIVVPHGVTIAADGKCVSSPTNR